MSRSVEFYGLLVLEFYMFVIATVSGIILILDPSGKTIQGDIILPYLPYLNDFLLIGLWLLFIFGLSSLVVMVGLFLQYRFAWVGTLILAILQLIWIGIEYILFYNTLGIQIFMIIIPITAIITILLLFRRNIKDIYFTKGTLIIKSFNI